MGGERCPKSRISDWFRLGTAALVARDALRAEILPVLERLSAEVDPAMTDTLVQLRHRCGQLVDLLRIELKKGSA